MKRTLATALAFFALAGTAVAQEAYGHWGYDGSGIGTLVDNQAVASVVRQNDPAAVSVNKHLFRWREADQYAAPQVADPLTTSSVVPSADRKPYPPHRFNWE